MSPPPLAPLDQSKANAFPNSKTGLGTGLKRGRDRVGFKVHSDLERAEAGGEAENPQGWSWWSGKGGRVGPKWVGDGVLAKQEFPSGVGQRA